MLRRPRWLEVILALRWVTVVAFDASPGVRPWMRKVIEAAAAVVVAVVAVLARRVLIVVGSRKIAEQLDMAHEAAVAGMGTSSAGKVSKLSRASTDRCTYVICGWRWRIAALVPALLRLAVL